MRDWSDEAFYGYAAGFLDGEGCIEINKDECGVRLRFANTHLETLRMLQERFNCGRIEEYARPKNRNYKRLFCFTVSSAPSVEYVLKALMPFICIKTEKATHALRIISRQRQRMEELDARNSEILRRIASGERQKDVASDYGISQQLVSRIKSGHTWQSNIADFNARRGLKKGMRPSDQVFRTHGNPAS